MIPFTVWYIVLIFIKNLKHIFKILINIVFTYATFSNNSKAISTEIVSVNLPQLRISDKKPLNLLTA